MSTPEVDLARTAPGDGEASEVPPAAAAAAVAQPPTQPELGTGSPEESAGSAEVRSGAGSEAALGAPGLAPAGELQEVIEVPEQADAAEAARGAATGTGMAASSQETREAGVSCSIAETEYPAADPPAGIGDDKEEISAKPHAGPAREEQYIEASGAKTVVEGDGGGAPGIIAPGRSRRPRHEDRAPQHKPELSAEPFIEPGAPPPLEEYAAWNRALLRHCLLGDVGEGEDMYLAITPRILAGAMSGLGGGVLTPDHAEARFADAVSATYRMRVLPHPRRLHVLRRCGDDGLPECTAFLALSVLAAFRMHSDEEAPATAYYMRLAELLRCELSAGHPEGFVPEEFEVLWRFLAVWLERERGRRLAMPVPDSSVRRFVALPLTHVPLRKVDIERLPDFFLWAGYEPARRASLGQLEADLSRWTRHRSVFTNAGMAALADDRRSAVLVQIAHELESWDGSQTDSQGRRTATVALYLERVRRTWELSYLPRRPAAFPEVYDDGLHTLEAGQDGWYSPIRVIPEDGPALQAGFSWEATTDSVRFALHRSGASVIAMGPSDFSGFVSRKGLLLRASGAALCHESVVGPAVDFLSRVTERACAPLTYPDLPHEWRLLVGLKPVRRLSPPPGLEPLEIDPNVEIFATGGLRLGRRWAWLAGAPPTLIAAGLEAGERLQLDGDSVAVAEEGRIDDAGRLTRPGVHVVEIGRMQRRLEILEPESPAVGFHTPVAGVGDQHRVVPLPRGSWTVIGPQPGDAAFASSGPWEGALGRCSFHPVWAVSVAAGRGARVLSLTTAFIPPAQMELAPSRRRSRGIQAWASAIYEAAIRRPTLVTGFGVADNPEAAALWTAYVEKAREVKRRLKAGRR